MVFVTIASETDDFPLGTARQHWDKGALDRLQPEINAAEIWAKEQLEPICAKLVQLFSYRANQADQSAWDRARRPKRCKLAKGGMLAHMVARKLQLEW